MLTFRAAPGGMGLEHLLGQPHGLVTFDYCTQAMFPQNLASVPEYLEVLRNFFFRQPLLELRRQDELKKPDRRARPYRPGIPLGVRIQRFG